MDLLTSLTKLAQPTESAEPPTPPKRLLTPDPGIPTNLLPPHIESWLVHAAALARVPPVMPVLPFLAGTGAVIGNHLGLAITSGWTEYPSLWVALVALTGTGKTPAISAARTPFDHLQQQLVLTAAEDQQPQLPLLASTVTWHRLSTTYRHTPGLLVIRDELFGFINAIDRRAGEERQFWLSLWSGQLATDTVERTPAPVVSLVGGIQPLLLHRIRHRYQDGLLERFLLVFTAGAVGNWPNDLSEVEPPLSPVVDTLRHLHTLKSTTTIQLTPAAMTTWISWFNANNDLTTTAPRIVAGYYRKLPSHLARLALILHALWNPESPTDPITVDTLNRAIDLVEYLRIHIHRSLTLLNERHPYRNPASLITDRITAALATHTKDDGWLTRSQLARLLNDPAASLLTTALALLEEAGQIDHRIIKTGGRPADHYKICRENRGKPG